MELGLLRPTVVLPNCKIVNVCSNKDEILLLSEDGKYSVLDFINISSKKIKEIAFDFKRPDSRRKKLKTISEFFSSRALESEDYEHYGKYVQEFFYGDKRKGRPRFSSSEFPEKPVNEEYGKLHDSSLVHQFRTSLSDLF